MDADEKEMLQRRISGIVIPFIRSLHSVPGVPDGFRPWESGLSPSAMYQCSLTCRKRAKQKTPEVKWISLKRWVTSTSSGIEFPPGTFLSLKRREDYVPFPKPHYVKLDYVLIMLPYGNVWSQKGQDQPISEEWLTESHDGVLVLESLLKRDAAHPVPDYMKTTYKLFQDEDAKRKAGRPNILWIHTKRKDKAGST